MFIEGIAESIAENYYNDDPCDPNDFECHVDIKYKDKIYSYIVGAENDIRFHVRDKDLD